MAAVLVLLAGAILSPAAGQVASSSSSVDAALKIADDTAQDAAPPPGPGTAASEVDLKRIVGYNQFVLATQASKVFEVALLVVAALVAQRVILRTLANKTCCKNCCPSKHAVNATGLIFIVFGTLVLMLLAENSEKLTAPIGILGAIAGYLFGTMSKGEHPHEGGVKPET